MEPKSKFERIFQVVSVTLIPISIATAGHLFGLHMKNAELLAQEKKFEAEHTLERDKQDANWRITKSELVYRFMDALSSPDKGKRKIAVAAILIALPEDGKGIVEIVAANDPDASVQTSARQSLQQQSVQVIQKMFSPEKNERTRATGAALSGWQNEEDFTSSVLDKAISEPENDQGVWNTVIYLENSSPEVLKNHEKEINDLTLKLEGMEGKENTLARLKKNVASKL